MYNFSTELFTENSTEPILINEVLKAKQAIAIKDDTSFSYQDYFKTLLSPSKLKLAQSYKSIIHACANINAQAVASVNWNLYVITGQNDAKPRVRTKSINSDIYKKIQKDIGLKGYVKKAVEITEVLDHPFLDLMDTISSYELFEELQLFQEVLGDGYLYVQRGMLGTIDNIQVIPSQYMEPERNQDGSIKRWRYTSGQVIYFKPEDIIHFQMPSLSPYTKGFAPAEASYEEDNLLNALRSFEYNLIRNGGAPGTILTPSEDIGKEEAERVESRFNKKYARGGMGGLFISCPGDKIEKLAYAPAEVEAIELHGVTKADIANSFGIPGPLLDAKLSPRAQLDAAFYQHARQAVLPRIKRLEAKLNKELISKYDPRLFIMFEDVVKRDEETDSRVYVNYKNAGILTVNEIREELGYDPLEEEVEEPEPIVEEEKKNDIIEDKPNYQGEKNAKS